MISSLEVSQSDDTFTCNTCIQAKIARVPLPKESREHAKKMGDRIYSDVWGPSRHQTIDKKVYYISFTDDYSRESVIYLMKTKDEAFQKYKLYKAMLAHQRGIQNTQVLYSINIWRTKAPIIDLLSMTFWSPMELQNNLIGL